MSVGLYLGFDFGFRRIGVAVGQALTVSASPVRVILAKQGVPDWLEVAQLIKAWRPEALIVGLPLANNDEPLYTTKAAKKFARQLEARFELPVHMVDERYTTIEAKAQLFSQGGVRKVQRASVDCVAACIILEQWMGGL